jgi:hypothetical protein
MQFRLSGMSSGGKYALIHLGGCALFAGTLPFGSVPSLFGLLVLGFPLLYVALLLNAVCGFDYWQWQFVLVILASLVPNSYLWGYAIAWIIRRMRGR